MLRLTKRPLSVLRAALAGLTALVVGLPLALPLQATPAQALPSGLPTHFSLGLEANPGDSWMPQSNIRWDYRYQYLSGGVNTSQGWETWNSPSGTFASNYAVESAGIGFIPMFPYYELLQSSGTCNTCGEGQRDVTNLNTSSLMNAYYQNFAILMKRLGTGTYDGVQGFSKTALVNVEPDFAGGYAVQAVLNNSGACFGFCTNQGSDPSFLNAAVSSSGFADVAAYPNTYAGFTQAIAHLRDLYAPNVLLGYDVSPWATGNDIGLDANAGTNAAGLGQQVGAFLSKVGPHDVLFNDPLDRDNGQYKAVYGQNRWWDRNNVTFPNFSRWEQYLHGAVAADGNKSMLLWQVPVGNQYFDTENNTNGHYQDNRAEYIFGHIQELIGVGIVGVMFGAGNAGNTTYNDATGDGITNPTSFCTTDGTSSGQICNNHLSTVSDDDGGYIRMQGVAYYSNPVPLSGGGTPTKTPTSTATIVATASRTATATATSTGTTSTLGLTTIGALADTGDGNSMSASRVVVGAQSMAVTSISAYVGGVDAAPHNQFAVAVYTDSGGAPGSLVAQSGSATLQANRWNSLPVAATLQANAAYWLAYNTNSSATSLNNLFYNNDPANVGAFDVSGQTFGTWPIGFGSASLVGSRYSLYATAGGSTSATATPTRTPTSTPKPSNTPTPTRTATQGAVQRNFTTGASASPATARPGNGVALTASVKSDTSLSALIDLEVFDPSGARVFQQAWDNQPFSAGVVRSFPASTWSVPAGASLGSYIVVVGVFSPGWGTLYSWNGSAATVTVN